jgi:hypothetical protein
MTTKYNPIGFNPDTYDGSVFNLDDWNYQYQAQTFKQLMEERDKVKNEILGDGVSANLDSLREIAASINDNANYFQDVNSALNLKANTNNPSFTGTVVAPTLEITNSLVADGEPITKEKLKRVKNLRSDVQQQIDDVVSGATTFTGFSIGQPVVGSALSVTGNSTLGNSVDDTTTINGKLILDKIELGQSLKVENTNITAAELVTLNDNDINIKGKFTALDTSISGINTRLTTAEGEIDTLISRADQNDINDTQRSNDISALQTSVSTLQGQMTTANSVNTSQATTLTSHGTSITSLNNSITTANTNISANASAISALQSADVIHVGRLDAIEGINTTQNGRLDAIETLDISQSASIASNASSISTINTSVSTINTNITTINGRLDGFDTDVSEINTALGGKQATITSGNRLNANLIADGSISNFEYQCLDNITGNIQQQIDGLLNNANLTGIPLAPTAISSTNTTQVATTAFVKTAINNLVNGAGTTLDTLNEIATALGNDPNFATTMTNSLGSKAPLVNPTFENGFNLNTNITANSIGITPTEISRLSGVSSNIQTALDGKQATISGSTNLTIGNLTTSSIVDNGALLCKGAVTIGDQVSDSITFFNGMSVNGLTKSMISLGNVDNKSSSTIKNELLGADQTWAGTNTFSVLPLCSAVVTNSNDLVNKTYADGLMNGKADDNAVVKLIGNQTISNIKTFNSPPVMSGASITSATIPQTSIVGLATSLASKQDTLTGSTNLTIGNLTTTSITDNGNATIKGSTIIGDSVLDSCTFYSGMSVNGLTKSHVGLSNVTNESKSTMFSSPTFTGTVSGVTASHVGLGNVTNESKTTMFSSPTFTGTVSGVTASHVGLGNVTNESKSTMFSSPTFTGTVSGVTASHVGLGNVTNESKSTMFSSPTFTGTVSGVTASHVGLGNVTNESKATMFSSPTLTGTSSIASATFSGSLVSQQTISLSEFINPVSVSGGTATCNYATSAIHLISGTTGSNFTCALTNVNPTASTYRTFTITLLIDSSTNKVYANALTVNGTSRTLLYNSGSSNIPTLSSATYILQTISIVFGASNSVPICCTTNVAPFY